jgi:hypothetical protein
MAANVVNTDQAIDASVMVVRAFVRLRGLLASGLELANRLDRLENRADGHEDDLASLFDAIRRLTEPQVSSVRKIGFRIDPERD